MCGQMLTLNADDDDDEFNSRYNFKASKFVNEHNLIWQKQFQGHRNYTSLHKIYSYNVDFLLVFVLLIYLFVGV